ncbi:LGFP repeat-containing protein [Blastococcus sp. SYSU D00922]
MIRTVIRLVTVVLLLAAGLIAPTVGSAPAQTAQAADLRYFDPGNIISDAVFYDYASMDAASVQAFLNAKGGNCTSGSLCLKNYRMDTTDRAGDNLCAGYRGAAGESAAVVIVKVAQSCRVSPRVLIVLLQKEMTLVTGSPTARQYERAAGYACPDSANGGCDPTYAGLQNQLYRSAWQYKRYQAYPNNYSFRAGMTNTIGWHPNAGCGSSRVYIANQATAGLYNYTPYRPNQAALNAGYGTGDSCSSYGNRNFWNMFTDWFGSTGYTVPGAIGGLWELNGGGTGVLGGPTGPQYCGLVQGGCGQHFQGGSVYWSPSTGAQMVSGAIAGSYASTGAQGGFLGYPAAPMVCGLAAGGCAQVFQGGSIFWSPASGAHPASAGIGAYWAGLGREGGPLGYPVTDMNCTLVDSGCGQWFERGSIYWSPSTGSISLTGAVNGSYRAQGAERSALRYPTAEMTCSGTSCRQDFQGGSMTWAADTGPRTTSGAIGALWRAQGGQASALDVANGDMICGLAGGGCSQRFKGGAIYWSPASGVHALTGAIGGIWLSEGAERGPLGYPITELVCTAGGCSQDFQAGQLAWTSTHGNRRVSGAIGMLWRHLGAGTGSLGYPLSDTSCALAPAGCNQVFQDGSIYWSAATGAYSVSGPIATAWAAAGAQASYYGYPVTEPSCTDDGCSQYFQGGLLAGTDDHGAFGVSGGIGAHWLRQGGGDGPLGFPVGEITCALTPAGCSQAFENGTVYWSAATGPWAVSGDIATAWAATGAQAGYLGYPRGEATCVAGGCTQAFQGGQLAGVSGQAAHTVSGAIGGLWNAMGGGRSILRYPVGPLTCTAAGCSQPFQDGVLSWDPAAGTHVVSGPLAARWAAEGGPTGSLGYATSGAYPVAGGTRQDFQGGRLTLDTASGTVTRSS